MPARGPLQTLTRPSHLLHAPSRSFHRTPYRAFSLPSLNNLPGLGGVSQTQTIQAGRTLPYPTPQVFALIADVDSYASFLPFCASSRVTRWTSPSGPGPRLPSRADLTVGWGPVTESYTSRLYCVPDEIVEAVSGRAETTIPEETLRKFGLDLNGAHADDVRSAGSVGGVFDSLVTRWALHPVTVAGANDSSTKVTLSIRFRFANPAYSLAVGRAGDNMVDVMIEAFERRARQLYGGQSLDR